MTLLRTLVTGLILLVISTPSYAQSAGDVWSCVNYWTGYIDDELPSFGKRRKVEKITWQSNRQFKLHSTIYKNALRYSPSKKKQVKTPWYTGDLGFGSIYITNFPGSFTHKLLVTFQAQTYGGKFGSFRNEWYECKP